MNNMRRRSFDLPLLDDLTVVLRERTESIVHVGTSEKIKDGVNWRWLASEHYRPRGPRPAVRQ
jgi:hypothetical protein